MPLSIVNENMILGTIFNAYSRKKKENLTAALFNCPRVLFR